MDGNQMSGFDIDVGNAISDKLGLEPIQKKYKFAGIVEGVKAGKFDAAVASHTINEERKKHVLFLSPITTLVRKFSQDLEQTFSMLMT